MRLPIDTSRFPFLLAFPVKRSFQYEEGNAWTHSRNVNGEIPWRGQLVALANASEHVVGRAGTGNLVGEDRAVADTLGALAHSQAGPHREQRWHAIAGAQSDGSAR